MCLNYWLFVTAHIEQNNARLVLFIAQSFCFLICLKEKSRGEYFAIDKMTFWTQYFDVWMNYCQWEAILVSKFILVTIGHVTCLLVLISCRACTWPLVFRIGRIHKHLSKVQFVVWLPLTGISRLRMGIHAKHNLIFHVTTSSWNLE